MASRELPLRLKLQSTRYLKPVYKPSYLTNRRNASSQSATTDVSEDVDPSSSFTSETPPDDLIKTFNPAQRSRSRKVQLPPSR